MINEDPGKFSLITKSSCIALLYLWFPNLAKVGPLLSPALILTLQSWDMVSLADSFSLQFWAPRHKAWEGLCLLITVSSAVRKHLKALPGKIAVSPLAPFCNIKLCIPARLHPRWLILYPNDSVFGPVMALIFSAPSGSLTFHQAGSLQQVFLSVEH